MSEYESMKLAYFAIVAIFTITAIGLVLKSYK
jgi:hypothetical protein